MNADDPLCFIGGEILPEREAKIPIRDRAFRYGEGLFEIVRVRRGRPFRLRAHLARLEAGAVTLGIARRESEDEIVRSVEALLERWSARDGVLRIVLTAGDPPELPPTLIATILPPRPVPQAARERGVTVEVAGPRQSPASPLPRLKSLNYLERTLARRTAESHGHFEALFVDPAGHVAEGAQSNIFWARGDLLRTPARSLGILPGVMRNIVIELAAATGVRVKEGSYPLSDLYAADEAFLTNALVGVLPVRVVEERPLRFCPGPLTGGLAAQIEALVEMECA